MNKKFDKLPNILILITDQDRATQHYPDGWEQENLKAMTLLKKYGLTFRNGFCNATMCSPSRATLYTSLYPAQHGVVDTLSFGFRVSINQPTLSPDLPNIAKMMRSQYDTHFRGKWHISKGGMVNVHPEKSLMAAEVAVYGFKGWTPPDAGENVAIENCGGGYADHDTHYIEQTAQFLRDYQQKHAQGQADQPFFLITSLVNPHDVLTYPQTYKGAGYTQPDDVLFDQGIDLPASVHENLQANLKPTAQQLSIPALATGLGPLPTDQDKCNYLNFYAYLQKQIDKQMYDLLRFFYDESDQPTDLGKETIIIRLADHGELGMTHGGLRQKAFNVYEETMRVPYIISNPVLFDQPYETDELASLIDIVPTLAGLLNRISDENGLGKKVTDPVWACGKDLSPVVFDPTGTHHIQDEILFLYNDTHAGQAGAMPAPNRIRCIRQHNWKYAHYFEANGSYPDEYELYFIAGVHRTDILPEKQADVQMTQLAAQAQPGVFDMNLFEQSLLLLTHVHPYEIVNLAYTDPEKNRWIKWLIKRWEGVYTAAQIIDFLDNKRQEMAHLLDERMQSSYINRRERLQWQQTD